MTVRFPFTVRLGNALVVYVAYLIKTVYPLNLAFYYPHPGVRISWIVVGCSAAVLLAVTAAAIVWLRRYPFLFVGWFWYLGTLVPTIGLVQIGIQQMADRYTYFPLIGIFIAFTWLVSALVPQGLLRTRSPSRNRCRKLVASGCDNVRPDQLLARQRDPAATLDRLHDRQLTRA